VLSTLEASLCRVLTFFDMVKEVFNASEEVALAFLYAARTLPSTPYVIMGTGSRKQCDPTTMRQIGIPGSPAAAYVVSTPGEGSSRACSSHKHFDLESTRIPTCYTTVCLYMYAFGPQYFCVKQTHFAETVPLPCPLFP
jgi:hypothetical protein